MKLTKKQKRYLTFAVLGAVLLLALLDKFGILTYQSFFAKNEVSQNLEVSFIDIGQGDSTLITVGKNAMLIDGGEVGEGAGVYKYMLERGVEKLDYVIATHPHSDHIGGIPDAVLNENVGEFILPDIPTEYMPSTMAYSRLLDAIEAQVNANKAKLTYAKAGAAYSLGEAVFTIISPNVPEKPYKDMNDYSVGILLTFGENSFMLTGDAEKKSEKDIISVFDLPRVDVFKAGHHGSSTSSSQALLDVIKPRFAVISCGKNNTYGHPNSETVNRLSEYCEKIFRTDLNGTTIFKSDGKELTVNCLNKAA